MNCQDALNLLYTIIDKEASEVDAQQVQEHLHKCKHCFEVYKLESHIQEFICAKLSSDKDKPAARLETLKQKIVIQLDTIDTESKPVSNKKNRPPFGTISFTLAAAAFLVVSIGAAIILAGLYRHNDIYIPLEQAHWDSGKQVARFESEPALTSSAMARVQNDLHYEVASTVGGFAMVGGQLETIMDVEMAHFVFANADKLVSVFVAPANKYSVPEDLKEHAEVREKLTLYDHNCRGCRLVFHRSGDVVVITATTDRQTDLMNFVPGRSLAAENSI